MGNESSRELRSNREQIQYLRQLSEPHLVVRGHVQQSPSKEIAGGAFLSLASARALFSPLLGVDGGKECSREHRRAMAANPAHARRQYLQPCFFLRRQWRCVLDIEYGDRAADLWGAHEFASATFPDVGRTISCLRALLTLFRRFRGHQEAVGASACRLPFAAHAQNTYHGLYF